MLPWCAGLVLLLAALHWVSPAQADPGRAIYREDAAGRRACVNCHGRDGRGGGEGSPAPADITWPVLSRERGYRDAAALVSAVASGRAPDGRPLAMPAMPLQLEEARALVDYLGRIEAEDRRGAHAGVLSIAVGSTGQGDPFPGLLEEALQRRNPGGAVFGWRFRLEPLGVEQIAALAPDAGLFAAIGLPEPVAGAAARALARAEIPNLMPRGFFVGSEHPLDGAGLYPTLSRIAAVAETIPGCSFAELSLRHGAIAAPERVSGYLRIPLAEEAGRAERRCSLQLVPVSGAGPANILLHRAGLAGAESANAFRYDPLAPWAATSAGGLAALAEITAGRLVDALVAARGQPGRTRFLAAFRASVPGPAMPEGRPVLDLAYPAIAATRDVSFVPVR